MPQGKASKRTQSEMRHGLQRNIAHKSQAIEYCPNQVCEEIMQFMERGNDPRPFYGIEGTAHCIQLAVTDVVCHLIVATAFETFRKIPERNRSGTRMRPNKDGV